MTAEEELTHLRQETRVQQEQIEAQQRTIARQEEQMAVYLLTQQLLPFPNP